MQTTSTVREKPTGTVALLIASGGAGLLPASVFALLTFSCGFMFSGISAFSIIAAAALVCAFVTPLIALLFKRGQRHFGWRALFIVVSPIAIVAVAILSWLDTRQQLRLFMNPSSVPSGLRVHRGNSQLFFSYVHFTCSPAAISSLLQLKGLVEVPAEPSEASDISGFSSREQTKVASGWWQPAAMSNPKFFFLGHKGEGMQGWSEGWWVSGATNEVYAFIGG